MFTMIYDCWGMVLVDRQRVIQEKLTQLLWLTNFRNQFTD